MQGGRGLELSLCRGGSGCSCVVGEGAVMDEPLRCRNSKSSFFRSCSSRERRRRRNKGALMLFVAPWTTYFRIQFLECFVASPMHPCAGLNTSRDSEGQPWVSNLLLLQSFCDEPLSSVSSYFNTKLPSQSKYYIVLSGVYIRLPSICACFKPTTSTAAVVDCCLQVVPV